MTPTSRLSPPVGATGRVTFPALGTTATLLTSDASRTPLALTALRAELAAVDAACSRFRPDSEVSRVNASAGSGRPVPVGPLLAEAVEVALRAARLTGGVVDPTVGPASVALGYDVTFTRIARTGPAPELLPAKGWQAIGWDPELRLLRLPEGAALDLGATAKALAADRAARAAAAAAGCGVLVNLGGDMSAAGPAPADGWRVAVADDHAEPAGPGVPVVTLSSGGLATSGTTVRRWERGGRPRHHIVDPATGDSAPATWRTVSVTAADCVDANTASTAAIVLGERAVDWLGNTGLPARLVRADGTVVCLNGWPQEGRDGPEGGRS